MFSSEHIQPYLNTEFLGRNIIFYPQTDSTNDDIWELYIQDNEQDIIVITDNQKQGRGRSNNTWFSKPGHSITCSFREWSARFIASQAHLRRRVDRLPTL